MVGKNIKLTMAGLAGGVVLGFSSLLALPGISYADSSVSWTGQGSDSVKACDTDQTPFLHWIFTTGGDSSVTSADLMVSGSASGGGAMSQHGGSWTLDTAYSGTGQPTTSTLTASVTFIGSLGNGNANLVISDGCFGTGGQGGGPLDCDNDTDNSPATECAPVTGGQGGGPSGGTTTTTTLSQGQVLAVSTTAGGLGGAQVSAVPQGSVNGGGGAGSKTVSGGSAAGLLASLLSVGSGFTILNRRRG
jgi:hypothetical protein